MSTIRIFRYISELDAFLITEEYQRLADDLGLTEWHAAGWIGRLFMLDADYGEHWFDNWDEREALTAQAEALGIDPYDLMIISPGRMASGRDGPCNTPEMRKRFWTDVLKSLEISYDLLFDKARQMNERTKEILPDEYIEDLEERISRIQAALDGVDATE
jgi:hypothetical protein